MTNYSTIEESYPTTTVEHFGGAFSIYSALNCPQRRPIESNKCFCTQPTQNSIWPQCQKYNGKKICVWKHNVVLLVILTKLVVKILFYKLKIKYFVFSFLNKQKWIVLQCI